MTAQARLTAPRVRLDDRAVACASREDFLQHRLGTHRLELHPGGWQELSPAVWKGRGDLERYQARTRRQCSVRVYSFGDDPVALGRTAIISGGEFLELPYLQFCETSRFNEPENHALVEQFGDEVVELKVPSDRLHVAGECALVTQQGERVWGHWLVDLLPRIKLVRELVPDATIALAQGPDWSTDLLKHAQIDMDNVVTYDPSSTVLTADRMFVPSFVRFANGFSPIATNIFDSLSREVEKPDRKLYITRSGTPAGSSILNHQEIEALFVRRGFEVVSPERSTVAGQVGLFAQACQIAGEYGSALHNSIFAARGTRVLSLQSEEANQFVQAGIGSALHQPTGFVFGEPRTSARPEVSMPRYLRNRLCWIDPALAEQALDEFLQS